MSKKPTISLPNVPPDTSVDTSGFYFRDCKGELVKCANLDCNCIIEPEAAESKYGRLIPNYKYERITIHRPDAPEEDRWIALCCECWPISKRKQGFNVKFVD